MSPCALLTPCAPFFRTRPEDQLVSRSLSGAEGRGKQAWQRVPFDSAQGTESGTAQGAESGTRRYLRDFYRKVRRAGQC